MSSFRNAVEFVHGILRANVCAGSVVVDATVGNGWDTAVLAELVGQDGIVFGFDIQQVALDVTAARVANVDCKIELHLEGHQNMRSVIPANLHGSVSAITFNLGYLPGGDKDVYTQLESTVLALKESLQILAPNGLLTMVCYRHAHGELELSAVRNEISGWDQQVYTVTETQFLNQKGNPPVVFVVQKFS